MQVLLDRKAYRVCRACREMLALLERLEQQGQQGQQVLPEQREHKVQLDLKELPEPQVLPEPQALSQALLTR